MENCTIDRRSCVLLLLQELFSDNDCDSDSHGAILTIFDFKLKNLS